MPVSINPIRYQKVKEARLQGKSKIKALKEAGYSEATYNHHGHDIPVIKRVDAEILSEAHKRRIIDKAWKVLQEGLDHAKQKYTIAKDIASKDMTEKQETTVTNNVSPVSTNNELLKNIDEAKNRLIQLKS